MRRIAIINQKGGVGKTTTTAHLGAALGLTGKRVLLIDMDPQAHLSLHFGVEVVDDQPSVYDVLTASLPIQEATITVRSCVHLVPADIDLAAAEAELISVMGREVILREALDRVDDAFDVLLIDCPPSLGVLTINALAACHEVIIPLQAQFFALQGLGKLLDTVRLVQQRINPGILVKGVALCMHDSSTKLSNEIVDDLTEFLGCSRDSAMPWSRAEIFKTRIRRNVKLAESSSFGQTVFEYELKSNGAIDYNRLAVEIFDGPSIPGLEETRPTSVSKDVAAERCDETVEKVETTETIDVTSSKEVIPDSDVPIVSIDASPVESPLSSDPAAETVESINKTESDDAKSRPVSPTTPSSSSPESVVSTV